MLSSVELEDLATRIIRFSAEAFVEELSQDENLFRYTVLQETSTRRLKSFGGYGLPKNWTG
jgi:hypothetical protein